MYLRKHPSEVHDPRTTGQKAADMVAKALGSWAFIIGASVVILGWIIVNLVAYENGWDPYPFILLNLVFSAQAFYAAPVIMMSQNRSAEKDRIEAHEDYRVDHATAAKLEQLEIKIDTLLARL